MAVQSSLASRVLLSVEDSDVEYYIVKMALQEVGMPVQLCRVADGEQALWFFAENLTDTRSLHDRI